MLACPRCGGRLRLIALIEEAAVIGRILRHLGVPTGDPRAVSRPLAADPRGSSRCGWLGRRFIGVQPLFLTFLSDGQPAGAPEVCPVGAEPRRRARPFALDKPSAGVVIGASRVG